MGFMAGLPEFILVLQVGQNEWHEVRSVSRDRKHRPEISS